MFRFGVLGRGLAAVVVSSLFVFGLNALPSMAFGAVLGAATGSFGGKIGKAAKILYRARNAFRDAGSKLRGAGVIEKVVGGVTDYGSNKLIGLIPPPPQRPANKTNTWPKKA